MVEERICLVKAAIFKTRFQNINTEAFGYLRVRIKSGGEKATESKDYISLTPISKEMTIWNIQKISQIDKMTETLKKNLDID